MMGCRRRRRTANTRIRDTSWRRRTPGPAALGERVWLESGRERGFLAEQHETKRGDEQAREAEQRNHRQIARGLWQLVASQQRDGWRLDGLLDGHFLLFRR